jgi:hypothetical protein
MTQKKHSLIKNDLFICSSCWPTIAFPTLGIPCAFIKHM